MKSIKVVTVVMCVVLAGAFAAQESQAQVVSGNTYLCYFVTPLDILSTNMTFTDKGTVSLSSFAGNGFYINVVNWFAASYLSLNAKIGPRSGDVIFLITGSSTFDPFLVGTGLVILEYSETYPMVFVGFRPPDSQ